MTKFPEFQSKAAHIAPSLVGLNMKFKIRRDLPVSCSVIVILPHLHAGTEV